MKPSVQKIINKLPKEKVDLATHKVDLARKPLAILQASQNLNDKIKKAEDKMEDAYQKYRGSTEEYNRKLTEVESKSRDLDDDLDIIQDKALDLGIKPEEIDGYDKAKRLVELLKNSKQNSRKYPEL